MTPAETNAADTAGTDVAKPNRPNGGVRRYVVGVLLVTAVVHAWIASAGHMWPRLWPTYDCHYVGLLSDAFLHGQTALRVEPDPRLLALPDPYNSTQSSPYRLHDALLFHGKYFLYWGPVPALLTMPTAVFGGGWPGELPDVYLTFVFAQTLLAITGLLLADTRRRYFPDGSRSTLVTTLLAAGLAMPLPFILTRGAVYETAILSGQCFLLLGVRMANRAFDPAGFPARMGWLATASVSWTLAVGCRVTLVFAVAALVALTLARWLALRPGARRLLVVTGLLLAPLVAGAAAFGAYNRARFGSWTELGVRYQLSAFSMNRPSAELFPADAIPFNLYTYLFRPWRRVDDFPGIRAQDHLWATPPSVPLPRFFYSEEIVGVVRTTPIFALLAIPVASVALRRRRISARGDATDGSGWLIASLFAAGGLGFLPDLLHMGSTMRYFADLTPSMFVLTGIAVWVLERKLRDNPRRQGDVRKLYGVATGYCVVVAIMLSITGTNGHFKANNPIFFLRMQGWFERN